MLPRIKEALTGGERGQIVVMVALFMVVMLGMTGLVIDGGRFYQQRRDQQNAADSAALAAAHQMFLDEGAWSVEAQAAAEYYADQHGYDVDHVTVNHPPQSGDHAGDSDFVEVIIEESPETVFMQVVLSGSYNVQARAVAGIGTLEGTQHFVPWGLTYDNSDCLDPANPPYPKFQSSCVLKLGAGSGGSGDYGALDPDGGGGGSAEYRGNIIDGTVDTEYQIGDTIDALAGNKTGPTDQGIDGRLASEPVCGDANNNGVDDFSEALEDRGVGAVPRYMVTCGESPRLMVVPIVDDIDHPQLSTIVGWALMYLEGYECVDDPSDKCNGKGHWEVTGTMVDAVWNDADGFWGDYDPDAALSAWFLQE